MGRLRMIVGCLAATRPASRLGLWGDVRRDLATLRSMSAPLHLQSRDRPSLGKSGLQSLVGVGGQGGARLLSTLMVGRAQGVVEVGHYAAANSTGQFLSILWPSSAGTYTSRYISATLGRNSENEAAAYARHFGRRSVVIGAFFGVIGAVWWEAMEGSVAESWAVLFLVLSLSVYGFSRGVLYGAGHFGRAAFWDLVSSALSLVGFFVMLAIGYRGALLVLPYASSLLIYACVNWPRTPRIRLSKLQRQEADRFVLVSSLGSVFSAGFLQACMVLARNVDSPERAGLFAAGMALATPLSLVSLSISNATLPALSAALGRGDTDAARVVVDQTLRIISRIGIAFVLLLTANASTIVTVVWGSRFNNSAQILVILVVAVLVNIIGVPSANTMNAMSLRLARLATVYCVAAATCGAVVWALLVPGMGVVGIAWGYLVGVSILVVLMTATTWRIQKQPWGGLSVQISSALGVLVALAIFPLSSLPGWASAGIGAALTTTWLFATHNSGPSMLPLMGRLRAPRRRK